MFLTGFDEAVGLCERAHSIDAVLYKKTLIFSADSGCGCDTLRDLRGVKKTLGYDSGSLCAKRRLA